MLGSFAASYIQTAYLVYQPFKQKARILITNQIALRKVREVGRPCLKDVALRVQEEELA